MQEMELTVQQVKKKIDDGDKFMMLDVREPNEYEYVHLDNSVLIPIGELQRRIGELPKEDEIVVVCHQGSRSLQVVRFLQAYGYNAKSMNGGLQGWADEIDHSLPQY